ncbi:MAG: DUF4276 family protein [Candidatus Competibacteraceae bacterium]|nr:DUF4276 family protein [Candidatus Competibacteraceae bacterium]MCB1822345.1 DUF4276 family protein [Candidatus Competibacteraceae bacterium]HRY15303.1 DUF4276 family protein [Candidatus Competibacteraceae bacterium]
MNRPAIIPIVEGHGEVEAVPLLLRRIACTVTPGLLPRINLPNRIKAKSFLNDPGYFRKHISLAAAKAAQFQGLVLILLDCEDDCPAELGPELLRRAIAIRCDVPYFVALAYREFETWFIAATESLRGWEGLPDYLAAPPDPQAIRGAKEWLSHNMPGGYDPVIHQVRFCQHFNFTAAAAIPSFQRLLAYFASYFKVE